MCHECVFLGSEYYSKKTVQKIDELRMYVGLFGLLSLLIIQPTCVCIFCFLDRVPWPKLRPLIAQKLESVIGEFLKVSPAIGSVAGVNSDSVSLDEMRSRLLDCVANFNR